MPNDILRAIIRIMAADGKRLDKQFQVIDATKARDRDWIDQTMTRFLTDQATDANGYLRPEYLTDEYLGDFEREILTIYGDEWMQDNYQRIIGAIQARVSDIDRLMRDLDLTDGILGPQVWEFDFIQEQTDRVIQAMIIGREGDGEWDGGTDRIRKAINRYKLASGEPEQLLRSEVNRELISAGMTGPNYVNSISTTALASIDRGLRLQQAVAAGIDHLIYLGPLDDLTRPFCLDQLGKIRTIAEWAALSNDMPAGTFDTPVTLYGGGINCRHRFGPWDPAWGIPTKDEAATMWLEYRKAV